MTSRMLLADTDPPAAEQHRRRAARHRYGADRDLGADRRSGSSRPTVFGFSGGAALLRRAAARAVGGFPRAVLPLLRGHRPLVAAAPGRLVDPVRAGGGRPPPTLRELGPDARTASPFKRAQPAAHAGPLRPGRGRRRALGPLRPDHGVARRAAGAHPPSAAAPQPARRPADAGSGVRDPAAPVGRGGACADPPGQRNARSTRGWAGEPAAPMGPRGRWCARPAQRAPRC